MARTSHTIEQALEALQGLATSEYLDGMARFAINTEAVLGVSMPNIRKLAASITKDHELALSLWQSGIHEARILASLVDHPKWVTEAQMDQWVEDFNSWDVCDQVCSNLFVRNELAQSKIFQWAPREEEYVRRAAFVMIAYSAVHLKKLQDEEFLRYFPLIEQFAHDDRNFVKKAVNWALRQLGKRSLTLHGQAIQCARRLLQQDNNSAQWIAKDALKELQDEKRIERLRAKEPREG